ncbi:MAG: hypothetical protein JXA74_17670 [Anaerolineae bacterium]|nr:hypothetical protein [Anaerolineae bacterium]
MPFWGDGLEIEVQDRYGDHPMEPRPVSFRWNHRQLRVAHISTSWRVHTEWWTEHEIWRDYWEVATADGVLAWLFYDRKASKWYLERVME